MRKFFFQTKHRGVCTFLGNAVVTNVKFLSQNQFIHGQVQATLLALYSYHPVPRATLS